MSKGVQIAGGATLVALLLGWYAWNPEAAFTYYQTLDEFRVGAEAGEQARVHGYVSLGSIERNLDRMSVDFVVQNDPPHAGGPIGTPLAVVFASLETPDLFKDGAEVVLEGQWVAEGPSPHFRADKLFAKCPSKFEGAEQGPPKAALN